MKSKVINIAADFSPSPAGRFFPEDGDFPGQLFRDKLLLPALKENDVVVVNLDGTDGYGSSFLEEAFGGLVRLGYPLKVLRDKLKLESTRESYPVRIWNYIQKADLSAQA